MLGRGAAKRKKKREDNKTLYNEHKGALELIDKHGDSLSMLGNNLELMKLSAILLDHNSPTVVKEIVFSLKDESLQMASVIVSGAILNLDMKSFMDAYQRGVERLEKEAG